ncbi:DeoR/GlpR family DNA-binding transcription regulator [Acetobacter oeni]|uniref:DeoR family transcriptional regulator n=1 Tax=Acetobacter oeni TaxID=304077 RepID=A0A511XQK7_9PROT|nr:DeoR/GlpR family DNA-binding transcription regulator [Acetobacter oeni]MBB3884796.1 DeoR family fructose operon transcriptional repressor [Acetobacter oeni]NHO20751.1 DeoR family transcriptional regulator [Acetobacter oeni]GBR05802.1 DeoR family transcriptional regulator [Acetobacter oeni LMG 21952]GEN65176.1 DeoR family transcriptional regulator [Acetobacter oeni]
MASDRLTQIRRYLYLNGMTGVHELAEKVEASLATIRRDLQRLEEQGVIVRTHGGAAIASSVGMEIAFETRESQGLEAKRAIADEAYGRLHPNSAIFLDAGTTVLQLAHRIHLEPIPLTVFSNNLGVVDALIDLDCVQTVLLGGRIRAANRSVVGPLSEQVIDGLWFDQLFLGASAVQPDDTIATPDIDEARLNSAMLARASERFLLVDSSKFGNHATYRVGQLTQITHLFTDSCLDEDWLTRLVQLNVQCSLAALESGPVSGGIPVTGGVGND